MKHFQVNIYPQQIPGRPPANNEPEHSGVIIGTFFDKPWTKVVVACTDGMVRTFNAADITIMNPPKGEYQVRV